MTNLGKATRTTVQIGSLPVDGFILPDGSYRMSQIQAAECVGKSEINAGRFLDSEAIKALRGNVYTPDTCMAQSQAPETRIHALHLLRPETPEALLGEKYADYTPELPQVKRYQWGRLS